MKTFATALLASLTIIAAGVLALFAPSATFTAGAALYFATRDNEDDED